jgi:hypothetical protein
MAKLPTFGLMLFVAIAIGTAGTLTKVMAYEPICPPGWTTKQTASDMLSQGQLSCVNDKGEVKERPLSAGDRASLCASLGKPQNC